MTKNLLSLLAAVMLLLGGSFASAATVVATLDNPALAATQGGTFSVTFLLTDNTLTTNSVTAASTNRTGASTFIREATITTAAPHGLSVGDDVTIQLNPASTLIDGTWEVKSVPSATEFVYTRDRILPATGVQSETVNAGSMWFRPTTPVQAAFRISWSDGTSGNVLTFNPAESQTLTGTGAVGALQVGPTVVDGASSYVNVTTESNTLNSQLTPTLLTLSFTTNPSAPLSTIYSITVEEIPVLGAYAVGRYKAVTYDFGAGTLFEVPQIDELSTVINDSALQNIEITATSVNDWMLLDL